MPQEETEEERIALDHEIEEICVGMKEAIDREVETLEREGWPIYVVENGRVVDLQQQKPRP